MFINYFNSFETFVNDYCQLYLSFFFNFYICFFFVFTFLRPQLSCCLHYVDFLKTVTIKFKITLIFPNEFLNILLCGNALLHLILQLCIGTTHQGDPRFQGNNAQCVAMSACAAVLSVFKNRVVFSSFDIDTILSSGDNLYARVLPNLPSNTIYLDPEELPTEIRVANYLAYIQSLSDNSWLSNGLFASSSGNKDVSFISLVRNLDSIFNSITFNNATDSVIFTGQYYAVSFWRHNNFYFLFNSHAVNSSNQFLDQDELNVARLFRCHNLTSLASLLFARNIFDGSQYSMHKLRVLNYASPVVQFCDPKLLMRPVR